MESNNLTLSEMSNEIMSKTELREKVPLVIVQIGFSVFGENYHKLTNLHSNR